MESVRKSEYCTSRGIRHFPRLLVEPRGAGIVGKPAVFRRNKRPIPILPVREHHIELRLGTLFLTVADRTPESRELHRNPAIPEHELQARSNTTVQCKR